MRIMQVKSVCKKCKCTEWVNNTQELVCKNCGNTYCSAHKWFIPCEENEVDIKDNIEFFIGNLEDFGINEIIDKLIKI